MADKFFRLLRLLQLVPRTPKSIDTERIEAVLTSEGTHSTLRTIQRDLVQLERMGFGLECVDQSKPYRWRFGAKADVVMAPGLDPQAALALRLVELHLERAVPRSTLRALQPHLQAARQALDGKPVARWLDRVRLVPRSQPLLAPKTDGAVTGVIHEALLEGRQVAARYQARDEERAKEYTLHPLGLIYRDSLGYLVATTFDYQDRRLYLLHRFVDAKLLEQRAKPSPGFDIDAFVAEGELDFRLDGRPVALELRFKQGAARTVEETPLSAGQVLVKAADGTTTVRASVPDTMVLRAWIMGFGASVEVVRPAALRRAIGAELAAAAGAYALSQKDRPRAASSR